MDLAPLVPWAGFRKDVTNSALGLGPIGENPGTIRSSVVPSTGAISSPALGLDDRIYVGTRVGVVALEDSGGDLRERWHVQGVRRSCDATGGFCETDADCPADDRCACTFCAPEDSSPECAPIGPVATTPALTPGRDLVAASTAGVLLALYDPPPGSVPEDLPECLWALTTSTAEGELLSPPKVLAEVLDNRLGQVVVGLPNGALAVFNRNGTRNWVYPEGMGFGVPATSTAALISTGDVFFLAPDATLLALGPDGRRRWSAVTSATTDENGTMPSPATAGAVYVPDGAALLALATDGTFRWRITTAEPLAGSPAVASQLVDVIEDGAGTEPSPTATAGGTQTPSPTPSPTPIPPSVLDTVVYAVDQAGTLYAAREGTGALLRVRTLQGVVTDAALPLPEPAPGVAGSPVLSSDLFAVYSTSDGWLYARRVDGSLPCDGRCVRDGRFCLDDANCNAGDVCERPTTCADALWSTCSRKHCTGSPDATCETDADCADGTGPCATLACSTDADCPESEDGEVCGRQARIDLGAPVVGEPTIDEDGNIYAVTTDGRLHVIGGEETQ